MSRLTRRWACCSSCAGMAALNGRDDYAAARVDAGRALAIAEERRRCRAGARGDRAAGAGRGRGRQSRSIGRRRAARASRVSAAAGTSPRARCAPCRLRLGRRSRRVAAGDRRGGRGRAACTGSSNRWGGRTTAGRKRTCRSATGMPQSRRASTPSPSRRRATSTGSSFASWFALRPIAVARGSVELLEQAYPRFAARQGMEPDSFYARIVAPRSISRLPTPVSSLRSFRRSSCACRPSTWITGPELARRRRGGRRCLARGGRTRRRRGGALADASVTRAVAADESGRCDGGSAPCPLLARRGAVADAIAAAESARVIHAPWWRAKASRLVGELAGDADALGEAERLERPGLGRDPAQVISSRR